MGLFDKFKKKNNEEYIDDVTFIRDIKHIQSGPWHQYDVLLAAQGYGWDYMISSADYMAAADLENISQVTAVLLTQKIPILQNYTKRATANAVKQKN